MAAPLLLLAKKRLIINLVKKLLPFVLAMIFAIVVLIGMLFTAIVSGVGDQQSAAQELQYGQIEGVNPIWQDAFQKAIVNIKGKYPACSPTMGMLTANAEAESSLGAGTNTSPTGDVTPPIIGKGKYTIAKNPDSDNGIVDGDNAVDKAVGPQQFMPQSFYGFRNGGTISKPAASAYGMDGNKDAKFDPHNIYDASLSALSHLCGRTKGPLSDQTGQIIEPQFKDAVNKYCGSDCTVRYDRAVYWDTLYKAAASSVSPLLDNGMQSGISGGDPNACPTDDMIPKGTIRVSIGANQLCQLSVLQARSPQAAAAIVWTFRHLGIPYGRPDGVCSKNTTRTGPNYYDCSGFVTSAYEAAGNRTLAANPATGGIRDITIKISPAQAKPGDLMFPHPGHVTMVLANGYIIHTNTCGDVSHVKKSTATSRSTYYAVP